MIRRLVPTAAALTLVSGSLCFASSARADDAPAPVVVVQPASTTTETVHTHSESSGPDMRAIDGGIFTFGVSYAVAVIVGATSSHAGDGSLYVPVAGPWMDFANRGGCPPTGGCDTETTNKVLLVVDGVFQALGALSIVSGFVFQRSTDDTTTTTTASRPSLQIVPQYADGGMRLAAVGRF
jgi:hypothetical protein